MFLPVWAVTEVRYYPKVLLQLATNLVAGNIPIQVQTKFVIFLSRRIFVIIILHLIGPCTAALISGNTCEINSFLRLVAYTTLIIILCYRYMFSISENLDMILCLLHTLTVNQPDSMIYDYFIADRRSISVCNSFVFIKS